MANYYVRTNGNDSYDGLSRFKAKLTLDSALTACSAGDTIYVGGLVGITTNPASSKANITIIADTDGTHTGDKGYAYIYVADNMFTSWTGTGLTLKNFLVISTTAYALYCAESSAKYINCIFDGVHGVSFTGSMFNCLCIGTYLASNAGTPTEIRNTIMLVTTNERAGQYTESNNYYPSYASLGSLLYWGRVEREYRIRPDYVANVQNQGTTGANIPTTDMEGNTRDGTPWIGPLEADPKEKTTLATCGVGDYIRCEYTAASNTAGTFANFGSATKVGISRYGEQTPDGSFKFYCVESKAGKGKLFIADRCVQHSVSWMNLNLAKYCTGFPYAIDTLIRMPHGGVTNTDVNNSPTAFTVSDNTEGWPRNNEWDTYVVNGTLGGTIKAGNNFTWLWSGIHSMMEEVPIYSMWYRTVRGSNTVKRLAHVDASVANTTNGFRPVLEYYADGTIWG